MTAFLMTSLSISAAPNSSLVLPSDSEWKDIAAVYSMIQTDYRMQVEGAALTAACLTGMLDSLDPQSTYLDKAALADLRGESPPNAIGIGVELGMRSGLPTIMSIRENSPAEKSGLKPRDHIVEIDGQTMEDMELPDALKKLRGAAGSTVTLLTRRPGEALTRTITLVREQVRPSPVASHLLPSGIGYLKVRTFTADTGPEVRSAFRALQATKPLQGLILDLRNSPGGTLIATVELAAMFLKTGALIFTTEGRLPEANQTMRANRDELLAFKAIKADPWPEEMKTVPLLVLVNGGTLSGAEIVAAALRDNARARLVGGKTFGRGTIQTNRVLSESTAIKISTATVKLPGGQHLHGAGLMPQVQAPDLARSQDAGTDADAGLAKAVAQFKQ